MNFPHASSAYYPFYGMSRCNRNNVDTSTQPKVHLDKGIIIFHDLKLPLIHKFSTQACIMSCLEVRKQKNLQTFSRKTFDF